MKEFDLRLRGHHLDCMLDILIEKSSLRYEKFMTVLRKIKLEAELEKLKKIDFVTYKILSIPNLRIKIILGLDDICEPYESMPSCPKLKNSCKSKISKEKDLNCIKKYGLLPNQIYSSSEILKILSSIKFYNLKEEPSF